MKRIFLIAFAILTVFLCACGQSTPAVDTEWQTEGEAPPALEDTEAVTEAPETDPAESEPAETVLEPTFVKPEISDSLKAEYSRYLSDSWSQKLEELGNSQGDALAFLVQTDPHMWVGGDEKTANNAKALSHFAELDFIAVPGDLIRGYAYDEDNRQDAYRSLEELVDRYTENVNCPVLMTFGNHDTNAMWCREHGEATHQINQHDHYFMVTERLKALNGRNMVLDGNANHYYMDFPEHGIRVIMLNTTDSDYVDQYGDLSAIGARQREWFREEALDTDHSVIVMSHIPLTSAFPENNAAPTGSEEIREAVEQFVADGGDFIAYMCGHVHIQADLTDENGRLHISFKNGGAQGEVVFVDTEAGTIRTVGLGKPSSRSFTYGE